MSSNNYPPSPAMVAPEKLNPSPAFRKQVAKVITAIILFFIAYLFLVAAAIALAITCCYVGIMLIVALPKFITLVAGLGLVGESSRPVMSRYGATKDRRPGFENSLLRGG